MNRHALYFMLFLCATPYIFGARLTERCNDCECKSTSKTFLSIRPPYSLGSPERLTFFRDRKYAKPDGNEGAWEAVLFGGRSTKTNSISAYFMPDCKTTLRITEQQESNTDVLANQLNIYTADGTFDSTITFCPRHRFAGIGLTYKQNVYEYCECHALWIGISVPLYQVKNSLNLSESITNNGGGINPDEPTAVSNATQAFRQAAWKFGRIEPCNKKITRLGDIELILGYEFVEHPTCQLDSFIGVFLPAGNPPKGHTVFEPIVGYNKHAAFFFGSSVSFEFWRDCSDEHALWASLDMNGQYFFRRHETRSMDLKLKPWSRYMQVYSSQSEAQQAADLGSRSLSTPGINVFTQKVNVHPGFVRVINTALIYEWCDKVEVEAGYNLYARDAECIQLDCPFKRGMALKSIRGQGFTNRVQQIGDTFGNNAQDAPNDTNLANYTDNIISSQDLDIESASQPCILEHTLYLAAAHKWDDRCHPLIAGAGGSYQFSSNNSSLSRWMLWATFGMSF